MTNSNPPPPQVSVGAAAFLNWLWAGAGYFVIGQKAKGIVFCIITGVLALLAIITCGIGLAILVPYVIVAIIDAVLLGQRINRGEQVGEWQFF